VSIWGYELEEGSLTLEEICRVIECEVITGEGMLDRDFEEACGADLMSDVLAYAAAGAILLTGLRNVQSVITSHVAEVRAIVYVRGKRPDEDAVKLAAQKGIPLLTSPLSMFEACGRLYEKGLKSGSQIGGK
jgi:predicted transcriptional regulator